MLDAVENQDEDEVKLENNLEGNVNQENEVPTTDSASNHNATPEITSRQAFCLLFER